MSASKEMPEKPSNSLSGLTELQPGPSSRCEPLENFYTKELKYVRWKLKTMYGVEIPEEVAPETLEFLKRNYDLKGLKKATAPVETLAEIANCMDLDVNAALNPGATPNPRMEQFKQIRNCMSRDIDAQRFVQPKANECFQVLPLFVKYPGGYDEENCQFVYEKLIQEEKIVPRGKDFEVMLKSDEHGGEFTAARKFYLPKLEKAVLIRGYSKDALMAVHDCKLHVCLTAYQLDLIKEYCIEYGVYGKLSTLVEESGDRIAMEIIKNPKAWDNFISKLEAATEFHEQSRLFSHFQETKENKALKELSKEPKDGCSSIKTVPAVPPAIPKEDEELEKLISQFQLDSKMPSSSVPSVTTKVVAKDDDEDWKKDADIEMQRRLLAQYEKNKCL